MYIIRSMLPWTWMRVSVAAMLLTLSAACRLPFGREYEYEEQLYLNVDGSASVIVDASIAALVALRGLVLDTSFGARVDPIQLRTMYESMGCRVLRVGQPWSRHGRRFIEVRLSADNVTQLGQCRPVQWSTYSFERSEVSIVFKQHLGAASGTAPANVNWTGGELVAFRMHLPSKILFHNVRRLEDNTTGEAERGNILTWEQRLADRLAGVPLDMEVRMEPQSILYRTLWLFAGSFAAAVVVLMSLIWWTIRRGKRMRAIGQSGNGAMGQ
jgi:hypothetical protein